MISKLRYVICTLQILVSGFVHCLPNCGQPGGTGSGTGNGVPAILSSSYPNARRDDKVQDTYAECKVVKDQYRWLEDPESEETKKFIEAENAITRPYLDANPSRADINKRFKELCSYPKYSGPFQHGKKFFSYQNTGSQNQNVLFVQDSLDCEGKVFIDPNSLSKDGSVALDPDTSGFSDDGSIFAYGLTVSGSDYSTIQFKHVEKGDIYKEKLSKVKFADVWWTPDNRGIFYGAMLGDKGKSDGSENSSTTKQKIYYHLVGTEQTQDVVAVEFSNQTDPVIATFRSNCGKYFIAGPTGGTQNNLVYVADLEKIKYEIKGKLELIPVVTKMEANYYYVANNERTFIFLTNKDADNYRLVAIDIDNLDPKQWKDFVPENKKSVLKWAQPAYNYLILCYIEDVKSVLQLHDVKTGKMVKKFDLELGTVTEEDFSGDIKYKDMYFRLESYLTPGVIYHCDLSKPPFDLEVLKELKVDKFNRQQFTVEQIFCNSKDGTKIPIYIIYKKGLQKNSNNPALLYAYGAYGYTMRSTLPTYKPERVFFADNFNGVAAVAIIRGGGELGEAWHRAGQLDKKQNSFDDYIAASEFLIAEKYTNNKLLTGWSIGGISIAVCLNQKPNLYGAAVIDVGILDMLRFQKFTIGGAWVVEFGSSDNEKDFPYLFAYSPLHNVKISTKPDEQYPAVLLTTSDHDDRVPPLHSLKLIATLQYEAKNHPNQKNPFLISIEKNGGHGGFKSTSQYIQTATDMMCFISNVLGVKFNGPKTS